MGKAGIATAGTTYSFFGLPYSELAAILTCVYVALQIADFIHRRWLKK